MARLIHVPASTVAAAKSNLQAPSLPANRFKVSRPGRPAVVEPWFELTPQLPWVDSRVTAGSGGVVAWLEIYGGVTRPGTLSTSTEPRTDEAEVVLAGNPVPRGTGAPDAVTGFGRSCSMRVAVLAQDVDPARQLLLIVPARGADPYERASYQTFLGLHPMTEDEVRGDDRIAVLLDVPADGKLDLEVWIRLCGTGPDDAIALAGAVGILL